MLKQTTYHTHRTGDGSAISIFLKQIRNLPTRILEYIARAEQSSVYAGVLHDISGPITSLLLQLEYYVPAHSRDDLRDAGRQIKTLIERTRRGSYREYGSVDVARVIDNVQALLTPRALERNIRIVTYTNYPILMYGSSFALQHIITNLASNAIDAYDTCTTEERTVTITATQHKKQIIITVHDHGCGIPPQHLSHIFQPFFTTKPYGSGFGLPLVRKLVRQAGGSICVSSTPPSGTYVSVTLPTSRSFRRYGYFRKKYQCRIR
ncbi:MAG: hypothetical protein RL150_205 [Candidatus Parcubacteria bacterium]|jgi:signal transduction histidine kinase